MTTAAHLAAVLGLSDSGVVFLGGGRLLRDDQLLPLHISRLTLLYSLQGGKGGFGALLRGGPGGLRTRKTTNFDACRDLSGRRLRHANAEERLREWVAKQAEREKQKKAEEAAKKAEKMLRKQEIVASYADESQRLQDQTASALQRGLAAKQKEALQQAKVAAKREKEASSSQAAASWDVFGFGDDLDNEDDDEADANLEGVINVDDSEDYTVYDVGRVTCDQCGTVIVGRRHHAVDLEDYDLCDDCHQKKMAEGDTEMYILVMQSLPAEMGADKLDLLEQKEEEEPEQKRLKK